MFSYFFFFNDTATTEIYTLSLHDALPIFRRQRLLGDREQPLRLRAHLPDGEGRGGVRMQAVEPHADVHAQEVPFLEDAPRRRNAVDDLLVDRGAQSGGEVVQSLERRAGAGVRANEVLSRAVELLGRNAGVDLTCDQGQRFRHDAAGGRHRLDLAGRLDRDHRPRMRWISVAISPTVPVPGTRCTMPRWAKWAMSGAVSRWYTWRRVLTASAVSSDRCSCAAR